MYKVKVWKKSGAGVEGQVIQVEQEMHPIATVAKLKGASLYN